MNSKVASARYALSDPRYFTTSVAVRSLAEKVEQASFDVSARYPGTLSLNRDFVFIERSFCPCTLQKPQPSTPLLLYYLYQVTLGEGRGAWGDEGLHANRVRCRACITRKR